MEEIYKIGKDGYLVSNYGNVKGKKVEFLKKHVSQAGYVLYGGKLGLCHRLVWETFNGKIPDGLQINHIDLNKTNNRLDNLELATSSENQIHAHKNGAYKTNINGENNPMATLTENDVLDIYKMVKDGYDNIDIAAKYNLHDRYVSLIRHGKRWKYLYYQHFNVEDKYYSLGCNYLNKEDVLKVLDLISTTDMSNEEIGNMFNLDKTSISKVRNKRQWRKGWIYYQKKKHEEEIE
jgi:hypothetical protein